MESSNSANKLAGKNLTLWMKIKRKLSYILHHKDPPKKVALGVALGMFVGMLPIMGIQMLAVTLIAFPLKANVKIAMAMVWISNPLTFIPLYWLNYKFGLIFVPNMKISWTEFSGILTKASDWNWSAIEKSLNNLMGIGADIFVPLWLGSLILGIIFGIIAYIVSFKWINFYRIKLHHDK
ncbi:MAG: DUF2062 domain-containing protein [Deltaproteobacteria bacterium]|nr:DUF2062 domain-containing protein [Deltaproteobacteria bacterium]